MSDTKPSTNNQLRTLLRRLWRGLQIPIVAIITSLILAAIAIILTAQTPAIGWEKVLRGYWGIVDGALLRGSGRTNTLVAMTPLILTGLAVAILSAPAFLTLARKASS